MSAVTAVTTQTRRGRARMACGQPAGGGRPDGESAPTLFDNPGGGEPTLDELVCGVWEGLAAHRHVACPICGGRMHAVYGAHSRPVEGRCEGCGTTLS